MCDNEEPPWSRCKHCGGTIYFQHCPTGGWWIHCFKQSDEHDAEPISEPADEITCPSCQATFRARMSDQEIPSGT